MIEETALERTMSGRAWKGREETLVFEHYSRMDCRDVSVCKDGILGKGTTSKSGLPEDKLNSDSFRTHQSSQLSRLRPSTTDE